MITCKLTGNLGNHISYYVSTRAIAEKLEYKWGFDPKPSYDYYNGKEQMDFLEIDYGKYPENIVNQYYEKELRYNHDGDNTDVRGFDPNVYNIGDNTELFGVFQASEYFYENIANVKKWLKIKTEVLEEAKKTLHLDENTCLINFRGGEYRNHSRLIIRPEYYYRSVEQMKLKNPNMKFIVITDDVECARTYLPDYHAYHFSIAVDYALIYLSCNVILSNSSFPIFAVLTSETIKNIIAPEYWARWNVSTGYWATSQNIYPGWTYLTREGSLKSYNECRKEADEWLERNY